MPGMLKGCLIAFVICAGSLLAQEGIQRGKVKSVDVDKGIITITTDGKDQEFLVVDQTKFFDSRQEGMQGFKEVGLKAGAIIMLKAVEQDGKKVLVGLKIAGGSSPRPKDGGDIRRAKIKKIDLDRMVLILTVDAKDQEFALTENTLVLDARGKDLKERLQSFKEGAAVMFKATKRDGKEVIVGLKLADDAPGGRLFQPKVDTSMLRALPELGTGEYQGFQGGFYPGGKNDRPKDHEAAGLRLAKEVVPRGADGQPSPDGKIVLLSIGMSNTSQASEGFARQLADFKDKNPALVFVNGAQGGMTAVAIQDPDDNGRGAKYWTTVDVRLKQAGASRAQVQAVWIKQADAGPKEGFPAYARKLQGELAKIVQALPQRFPNIKMAYLSSRTYAGFATTPLNPEPYAYESGFSVRWLIEDQLKGNPGLNFDAQKGKVKAPWLSWGPYLWANGAKKNGDGLFYEASDFSTDGTHHARTGTDKLGRQLLEFFRSDATTRPWFVRP